MYAEMPLERPGLGNSRISNKIPRGRLTEHSRIVTCPSEPYWIELFGNSAPNNRLSTLELRVRASSRSSQQAKWWPDWSCSSLCWGKCVLFLAQMSYCRQTWNSRGSESGLSLIHISEPTRLLSISYAVFCLKKKKKQI
eukprot:TRINITY_DN25717_c0_g1_i1.p1 TRINITY_DN25717_c0_g1~~TRINITY_DN25717_c0_g1_i1.p1  ORF type:complete len:139 (+),score=11.63 TRINITY_DN25717_c0_g1_i1:388-804(+)